MSEPSESLASARRGAARRFVTLAVLAVLAWTTTLVASLTANIVQTRREAIERARSEARGAFFKDVLYRKWAAGHGGVYAPVSETTQPNVFLTDVEEREILTPSGRLLTLINPAYMSRQVWELQHGSSELRSRLTSLKPIRPANSPDDWERMALESFENGSDEYSSLEIVDGREVIRFMGSLVTESTCLECHAHQGYKIGDVRGGISVHVPMSRHREAMRGFLAALGFSHLVVCLIGVLGLAIGFHSLLGKEYARLEAQAALRSNHERLESEIDERTQELSGANAALQEEASQRREAEHELRTHKEKLEELVDERTAKLQKSLELMAGRELRMAELKRANEDLRRRLAEAGLNPDETETTNGGHA